MNFNKSICITFILLFFITFEASAQARTSANVEKSLVKAADESVATYKKSGMSGLIVNTQNCYERAKINPLYCVYLDLASRHIDQIFVEAMHFPPNEFYADEQFGSRIITVLAKENMSMDVANQYLATVTPLINKFVEKKLINK